MGAVTITVTDVENFDWDGDSRPDHNFNGVTIPLGGSLKQREEINKNSAVITYTLHLMWENGVSKTIAVDQDDCIDQFEGVKVLKLSCSGSSETLNCAQDCA